jgi:glycosidase
MTVGEIWDGSTAVAAYVQGDELDLAFDFNLARGFVGSVADSSNFQTKMIIEDEYKNFLNGAGLAAFLTNHDMTRSMNSFLGSMEKGKVAAALLLTSPGVPFLYYGEEIGMSGAKPDPQIRTPMQWSLDENAGFSVHIPWEPVNPDFQTANVKREISDPKSLLSMYRLLIQLRNEHPVLRFGDIKILETANNKVYAALRWYQDEAIIILLNLTSKELSNLKVSMLKGPLSGKYSTENLLDGTQLGNIKSNESGGFTEFIPKSTISPNEILVISLKPEK